ncbi:excinuclease ABC subunit UvrC [bacterium]|nr:excinuclease ABC subunit UvrC [bacterium]
MVIQDKLKTVPKKPGVYLLKDRKGKMIYIGKAKNLHNRIRSHFSFVKYEDSKHQWMMKTVVDFETIVTDSEVEALILEANLVKVHKPRYNVNLKDDKSYPYIRITHECYPRVFITRNIKSDGSKYFGPYTDVGSIRQLMAAVRRIFPTRTCSFRITDETIRQKKHKVCLNYHIGRCGGPCEGIVSQDEYSWMVEKEISFIRGKDTELVKDLENRMKEMAQKRRFEEAARLRNAIRAVSLFRSKQKVVDVSIVDRDLIAMAIHGEDVCCVVFHVRDGKIVNRQHFYLQCIEGCLDEEIVSSFLKQYYSRSDFVPAEVHVPVALSESRELSEWLSQKRNKKVVIVVPQKGKKSQLLEMCTRNAHLLLEELLVQKSQAVEWIAPSVKALQKDLGLKVVPKRIEAFDVSNIVGQDAVASMVVFENGKPKKSAYRKFKIRTVAGVDDFRMMAEAVGRRYARLLREKKPLPDLILVDGGKGQLSAVLNTLRKLAINDQPVIGLAKRLEEIYIPNMSDPQTLPKSSPSLRLLQRVRDEAHRFAVAYHRTLRKKRTAGSVLDDIPGIGEKRRNALLRHFGSIERIKNASIDEIISIEGMNRKVAENVLSTLKQQIKKNK